MPTTDAPSQPTCTLGVSDRMLSAFRDDVVSRAEAARLAAHVEMCPACRERLATFDILASALRSERPPEPDVARLWQAILIAANTHGRVRRFSGIAHLDVSWRRLSAIAAVIILCVGFATVFSLHRPTSSPPATPTATLAPAPTSTSTSVPTATATPALLPARPLVWQPVGAPASAEPTAFANDGETAYMCAVESTLRIWRTGDQGAHWIPARVVPNDPSMNMCELVVDVSDPTVAALAWSPRGGGAGDPFTGLMTTVDGGATWQATPSAPFTRIDQLDSRGGVIYALRETVNSTNAVEYHLWASADRMRSWRQIDHGLPSAIVGFWLQPSGSGIVIVVSGGATGTIATQLWSSPDDGGTWRLLDVPGIMSSYWPARSRPFGMPTDGIVVHFLHGQFHVCVADTPADMTAQNNQTSALICSTDGGVTWQTRTSFPVKQSALIAIADDGALLAVGPDASGSRTLYRLAASADQWQSLGALPESDVAYCPAPGSGVLWSVGYDSSQTGSQQSHIFTTNYLP